MQVAIEPVVAEHELTISANNLPFTFSSEVMSALPARLDINPLINIANPIFKLLEVVSSKPEETSEVIRKQFIHLLTSFEEKAESLDYSQEIIWLARYILCQYTDEVLQAQYPFLICQPASKTVAYYHFGEDKEHNLGAVIEKLCQEPGTYIDLLEFIYLAMALGFKAKQCGCANEQQRWQWMQQIYQRCRQQRGANEDLISEIIPEPKEKRFLAELKQRVRLSLGTIVLATGFILGTLIMTVSYLVSINENTLIKQLDSIQVSKGS